MKRIFFLFLVALFFAACGADWSVGPDSGKSGSFDRSYHYYYEADCRYDAVGIYDCSDEYRLSQSVYVRVQMTYDGYVTLNFDGDIYYYDRNEYSEGYDDGDYYYQFYGDDWELTVYEDGSEMIYVDEWKGTATYFYPY